MTEPGANKIFGKWRRPGFLLEPLGWVQDRLRQAIEVEPRLVELLFDLDHARMHLTALALAHMNGDVTPDLALILLQESRKTILNLSVGHRPVGIGRALRRLPPKVLAAEIYRKLVDLLDDPVPAKFLHHTGSITDLLITSIYRLPASLRTAAIMAMFNQIDDMIWFVDGLRVLASRAGLRFDTLAHQIGALDQPDQVAAKIRQVVNSLPLPATLPPAEIEGFRRLDTVAEIRELPKIGAIVWPVTCSVLMTAHLQSICRSSWRLFVLWVATAAWAGFWFRPRVREMPTSSRTSSRKFMPPSPTLAFRKERLSTPSKASFKPVSGHAR
jgi:hypothetical protein